MTIERIEHYGNDLVLTRERVQSPRPIGKLFDEILQAKTEKRTMDPLPFMQELVDSQAWNARTSSEAVIDPNKPLILVPNHYHNPQLSGASTIESMKNISIVTDSADIQKVTSKHVAWFIKYLTEYPLPTLAMKARRVQNAAPAVFEYLGVKVGKTGIENMPELAQGYNNAKRKGSAIGYFPEQEPSSELKKPHENFSTFVRFTQGLFQEDVQLVPVSVRFNDRDAEVHYGKEIVVSKNAGKQEIAEVPDEVMSRIARYLPPNLRGPYA